MAIVLAGMVSAVEPSQDDSMKTLGSRQMAAISQTFSIGGRGGAIHNPSELLTNILLINIKVKSAIRLHISLETSNIKRMGPEAFDKSHTIPLTAIITKHSILCRIVENILTSNGS